MIHSFAIAEMRRNATLGSGQEMDPNCLHLTVGHLTKYLNWELQWDKITNGESHLQWAIQVINEWLLSRTAWLFLQYKGDLWQKLDEKNKRNILYFYIELLEFLH